MAATAHQPLSRRLVTAATALMPSSRRDWGRAISAELACASSRAERARLVIAAARIVALGSPGFSAGVHAYARAAGRSVRLALIAYVPAGLALYLLNVVLASAQVTVPGVLAYGYPLIVLLTAGARARRASAKICAPAVAGLAAGLVLAILALGTVAVLDNAFLTVISRQPDAVEQFRASGMTSMRAYLNRDLESAIPVVVPVMTVAGAFFGSLGPVVARAVARVSA